MHQILTFWHTMFSPIGSPWPTGGFYSNQTQWTIVWLPTLVVVYRQRWECTEKGCWRFGHHKVGNTKYKTCSKHTNDITHARLMIDHKRKHPHAHAFLHNSKKRVR